LRNAVSDCVHRVPRGQLRGRRLDGRRFIFGMSQFASSAFTADSCVVADVMPSPNQDERRTAVVDMIVLHYTGMPDAKAALQRIGSPRSEVSAHYLVCEDGRIVQCVPERRRAWHAGEAFWAGETDINSCSIGIEIANPGHEFGYSDFPKRQIAAVTTLCRSIQKRFSVPAERVLGHSDVAPKRKQDPGEKFPWETLHHSGVGQWVRPVPILDGGRVLKLTDSGEAVAEIQRLLAEYGYGIAVTGHYDGAMHDVVAAFQRHFRPARVDGIVDQSTAKTLLELLANRGKVKQIASRIREPLSLRPTGT
jgi:N-acetylmuramoyl-L-alanine amidase